jgi:hypothetical protein
MELTDQRKAELFDVMLSAACRACPQNDTLIKREQEMRDAEATAARLTRENQNLRLQISRLEAQKRGDLT